jgi:hypothetical protein
MDLWQSFARPPETALKRIGAGRLRGKTDISPQWRYQAMTEAFGACGLGWYYTIDDLWTVDGDHGEVFAFARVSLYIRESEAGTWSMAIPGVGGSMLQAAETKGIHNNDEAYKMATTDALGVAMNRLGVAADIYLGLFDGSKYTTPSPAKQNGGGQPKNSFTQPPPADKPKEFSWRDATSAQRADRVLLRIGETRSNPSPKEGLVALKEIAEKLVGYQNDIEQVDMDRISGALVSAEASLEAECSG